MVGLTRLFCYNFNSNRWSNSRNCVHACKNLLQPIVFIKLKCIKNRHNSTLTNRGNMFLWNCYISSMTSLLLYQPTVSNHRHHHWCDWQRDWLVLLGQNSTSPSFAMNTVIFKFLGTFNEMSFFEIHSKGLRIWEFGLNEIFYPK